MVTEAKVLVGVLVFSCIVFAGAYTVEHLIAAGKAECVAQDATQVERNVQKADQTSENWQEKYEQAVAAHALEVAQLQAQIAGAGVSPVIRLSAPATLTRSTPVSGSASVTRRDIAAVAARLFHCPTVPGAPGPLPAVSPIGTISDAEWAIESAQAQRADQLNADYREVYNAWPSPPDPKSSQPK